MKVVTIDDEEISIFILKKMIQSVPGNFEIFDFIRPEIAINEIGAIQPDVIFLDINMPVMNGWKFLEAMQKNGQSFPVYILTSSTSELDRLQAKEYPAVKDFLNKPAQLAKLSAILLDACPQALNSIKDAGSGS